MYSSTITLLLVSPWGASYSIGTFPNDELMDVSRNGRRVLLGTNSSLLVIDLESGTTVQTKTFASMSPYLMSARFTQPDGQAFVLLMAKSGTDLHLDWFNGSSDSPSLSVSTDIQRLRASPDGRYLVGDRLTPSDSIVILDSQTGKQVATIPTPTGEYRCTTSNWWSDDEIVISCPTTGSTEQNVWRYSLSAKTTKRIGRPLDDNHAYPTPVGTVVAHSLNTCNGEPLGILNSDGNGNTPLATQPRMSGSGNLFTVVGTTAYLVYYNCATGNTFGQTFIAYNLTTHTTTTLVAGATNAAGAVWTLVVR